MSSPKQLDPMYVTYNEVNYAIYPFPAMDSVEISGDLAKIAGPIILGLAPLFTGAKGGDSDDLGSAALQNLFTMSNDQLIPLLQGVFSSLDGKTMRLLVNKLLIEHENIVCEMTNDDGRTVQRKLTSAVFNELFIGNLDVILLLIIDVVRLNFQDFFKNLLSRFGAQQDPLKAQTLKDMASSTGVVSLL